MKNSIKTELWKATHNPFFVLSIAIGMIIILCDVVQNAQTVARLTALNIDAGLIGNGTQGISLFTWWIALNGDTFGSIYFYIVWPILAAMPYGWSYSQEDRSGVINQYLSRSGKKKYFVSKYIAMFVSGGIAVALPVTANLLLNALFCPDSVPEVTHLVTVITDGYFLSELFYTNPWAYAIIWCGVEFLYGGVAACMCFLVGSKLRFQVMVMLTPFIILYVLNVIGTFVLNITHWNLAVTPLNQAMAAAYAANPEWLVFSTILFFAVLSFGVGYWQVTKHEMV